VLRICSEIGKGDAGRLSREQPLKKAQNGNG
jgi:hypothetical protein